MKRQTWTDLSTSNAIADAGTSTAAASALGVTPPALSHAMRAMEQRMGVRLLYPLDPQRRADRGRRAASTETSPGDARPGTCRSPVGGGQDRLAGRIRVNALRRAAMLSIAPKLPAFMQKYSDIQIEFEVEDGLVDIVAQGFDAGVRHEQVLDNDMISVRISEPGKVVYVASLSYWKATTPRPIVPRDLLKHRCVVYYLPSSAGLFRWRFVHGDDVVALDPPAVLISNDIDVVRDAAIAAIGVACLLESQVRPELADGRLVAVLGDWSPSVPPNYLYHPGRHQLGPAMRAFIGAMRVGSAA